MPNTKTNRHAHSGGHQEIHIGEFKRDRIGIVSGVARRERIEDFDTIDWNYLTVSAAPAQGGVPCVNVVRTYDEKMGMATYMYSYEGVNDEYQFGDHETTYELDISMSEDPIETHINFTALKKKYGWLASKRQFPEFMPGSTAAAGTGLSASTAASTRSDLFGTDSYLAIGAHYRISYARGFIPAAAVARTNEIVKSPRGIERFQLPGWARKRNWLCLGPHATHRGNACQISEEYLLSGPRGWNRDVYGAGKLGGSGNDPGT